MYADNAIREIERLGEQLLELLSEVPDEILWQKPDMLPNSIGAIARHLAGNLNHYLGAGILQNGYKREREQEFHASPISRNTLLTDLRAAIAVARSAVAAIDEDHLAVPHTTPCGQEYDSLSYHLARLATHFAYHVGEAYYASKLLDNGPTTE